MLHAHAHDIFLISPVLGITSPTPECGKSTLLTIVGAIVPRALTASNITTSGVFRAVDKWRPTLLIDEADTFIGVNDEMRGVLNSGHQKVAPMSSVSLTPAAIMSRVSTAHGRRR